MCCDGRQPCGEDGSAVKILNVNEGAQKGILEGIFCVFMISGDAVRIQDKPSRVRLAQCGEGFRLPLLCCRYQGVFAHCRLPRDCIAMMNCSCSANKPTWSPVFVTRC